MGYTTDFIGELGITPELKAKGLAHLNKFLGKDIRDHDDWPKNKWGEKLYYTIDLELTENFKGLKWDGSEKSYEMVAQVNYLISVMKEICPEFNLSGKLEANGEEVGDRWELVVVNGEAQRFNVGVSGKKVTCPKCSGQFMLEDAEVDDVD